MIKHIVMWKFKDGEKENMKKFLEGLNSLKNIIPEIKYMETGININPKNDYDAILISEFETMDDLEKYKNKKLVAFTFDDGPNTKTTTRLLDGMEKYDAKATFFVLGNRVAYHQEVLKRAYQEGHYIANHGYSHQYSQIYSSPETVLQEFNQCNSAVAKAIDVPEYNSHLFRFPGGSVGGKYANLKAEAVTLLEQNNIMHVDWNALTGDAEKSSPDEEYLMNNLQKTTQNKNSIVILMHDAQAKRVTVEFLPKLIEFFQQQGYQFENFYSIIK